METTENLINAAYQRLFTPNLDQLQQQYLKVSNLLQLSGITISPISLYPVENFSRWLKLNDTQLTKLLAITTAYPAAKVFTSSLQNFKIYPANCSILVAEFTAHFRPIPNTFVLTVKHLHETTVTAQVQQVFTQFDIIASYPPAQHYWHKGLSSKTELNTLKKAMNEFWVGTITPKQTSMPVDYYVLDTNILRLTAEPRGRRLTLRLELDG